MKNKANSLSISHLNAPHFAPLYKYNDMYDTSLINLIKAKGYINFNKEVEYFINNDKWLYLPSNYLIDNEIERIKPDFNLTNKISSYDEFMVTLKEAIIKDIKKAENDFKGYLNVIMCGGKDSLNLLLLPWENPVLVVSAMPNYLLVKQFIKDNGLNYKVIELIDKKPDINKEILINCCRLNLHMSCAWHKHLEEIATENDKKVIFWVGQLGDLLLVKPGWINKTNTYPFLGCGFNYYKFYNTITKNIDTQRIRESVKFRIGNHLIDTKKIFFKLLWKKYAHLQGVHMGIINEHTGAPVLSGYHGKNCWNVFTNTDYERVITRDLRSDFGRFLFNKTVIYPETNPSPGPYFQRKHISDTQSFLNAIQDVGIKVYN